MRRRTALKLGMAALAAALAGCGGAHDGGANLEPDPQPGPAAGATRAQPAPAPVPEPFRGNGG